MGAAKKGYRRIICDGAVYFWRVGEDADSPCVVLDVISEKKQLILACPLGTGAYYVISKGRLFQNQPANGCCSRYRLPFDVPDAVTPRFVARLIDWAIRGRDAAQVKWDGAGIIV